MKKQKTTMPYVFKDMTHQDMVDKLDTEMPIKLKHNEDLINRVYARYPLIKKSEVSLIVLRVFQGIRELLILGKILQFNKLFFDTKLLVFDYRKDGAILPAVKVHISTPPPLKK